jgi:hypothetical protein
MNTITKKIEQGIVYLPGKYNIGPNGKFLDFPTSYQWIHYQTGGGDSGII